MKSRSRTAFPVRKRGYLYPARYVPPRAVAKQVQRPKPIPEVGFDRLIREVWAAHGHIVPVDQFNRPLIVAGLPADVWYRLCPDQNLADEIARRIGYVPTREES